MLHAVINPGLLICGDGGSAHSLCKTRGKNNSELHVMELED